MAKYKVKRSKIDYIFITHMHGDHVFGLPGLLNSFNLNNRKNPLTIIGPHGIRTYIQLIADVTGGEFRFPLNFVELEGDSSIDLGLINELRVMAFPLKHRIPTFGYKFTEEFDQKNIIPEKIKEYSLTHDEIIQVKNGLDLIRQDGRSILNAELTFDNPKPRSFAYVTDTIYDPSIIPHVHSCNMMYHEATYLEDLKEQAHQRMHATAMEAASIALSADIRQLIIGHYSSRYRDLNPLLSEAQSIFANTHLALEGVTYEIN